MAVGSSSICLSSSSMARCRSTISLSFIVTSLPGREARTGATCRSDLLQDGVPHHLLVPARALCFVGRRVVGDESLIGGSVGIRRVVGRVPFGSVQQSAVT